MAYQMIRHVHSAGLALAAAALGMLLITGCETGDSKAKGAAANGGAYSAAGFPDLVFGTNGFVTYDDTSVAGSNGATALAIQPDGKIVLTGVSFHIGPSGTSDDMVLMRLNTNGTLDTTFGGTGVIYSDGASNGNDVGRAIAIQPDGKIVVAGEVFVAGQSQDMAVWRFNPDGTPDTTFNGTGFLSRGGDAGGSGQIDSAQGVAIDALGRIVVVGYSTNGASIDDAMVWRFTSTGSLDTGAFGGGSGFASFSGGQADVASAVAIDGSGKIVVTGWSADAGFVQRLAVWRFTAGGVLDAATFNSAGAIPGMFFPPPLTGGSDQGTALTVDAGGTIVVSGISNDSLIDNAAIWSVLSDGSINTAFGGSGTVLVTGAGSRRAWGLTLDSQGRIVAVGEGPGSDQDLYVWRFEPVGTLDPTFGPLGVGYIQLNSAAHTVSPKDDIGRAVGMTGNGRIVVAGSTFNASVDVAVWRFQ